MEGVTAHHTDVISWRIIEALAAAADIDPLAVKPPLDDVVDVDALARLIGSDALDEVQFEYEGCTVAISGDGRVSVDGPATYGDGAADQNFGSTCSTYAEYDPRGQES